MKRRERTPFIVQLVWSSPSQE